MEKTGKGIFFLVVLALMFLVSAGILAIVAAMMLKGHMSTGFVSGGVIGTYVISCFLGGFLAGRHMGKHKFIWGVLVAGCYFFVLCLAGKIVYSGSFAMDLRTMGSFLICIVSGMLGGMMAPAKRR
jgi:putative membrane protein (TIGR04086 family)